MESDGALGSEGKVRFTDTLGSLGQILECPLSVICRVDARSYCLKCSQPGSAGHNRDLRGHRARCQEELPSCRSPPHTDGDLLLGPGAMCCCSLSPWAWETPVVTVGTRAPTRDPLLSRIIKMMKLSNQLCSTMRWQVLRSCQPTAHGNSVVFTMQQGQWRMQPVGSVAEVTDIPLGKGQHFCCSLAGKAPY